MNTTIWIVLGVAAALVLVYLLVMRVFYRQSRALDRQIDYSKMRPWTGDDGEN
jgi:low affinity Fe/Cu permease